MSRSLSACGKTLFYIISARLKFIVFSSYVMQLDLKLRYIFVVKLAQCVHVVMPCIFVACHIWPVSTLVCLEFRANCC